MRRTTIALTLVLLAGQAYAGTLKVNDEDSILTNRADLEAAAAAAPFDVLVVASTKAPSNAEFDRYIDGLVPGAQSVVIGLDIEKRHTHAIAGPWVRISGSAISAACSKGNPYFKQKNYSGGLARIITEIAGGVTPVASVPAAGTVAPSGLSWGWVLLGGIGFGLLVWGGIYVGRLLLASRPKKKRQYGDVGVHETIGLEHPEYYANRKPAPRYTAPPPTAQATQQPVVAVDRGRDTSLTDFLVLDHVLNASHRAPAPQYVPPRPEPEPSRSSSSSGSYSSGGSSWDFGGGSSGGSDWGSSDSGGGSSGGSDW